MNKRGQALVEFIIIAPILIMMILAVIDFGKIFYTKNALEGELNEVIMLKSQNKTEDELRSYVLKNDDKVSFLMSNNYEDTVYELSKDVELFTPGLNVILKSPYKATVKRIVPNES